MDIDCSVVCRIIYSDLASRLGSINILKRFIRSDLPLHRFSLLKTYLNGRVLPSLSEFDNMILAE